MKSLVVQQTAVEIDKMALYTVAYVTGLWLGFNSSLINRNPV